MEMQHLVKVVMGATVMSMEAKHWAFVTFRQVYVSVRITQLVIIVINANLATTVIQGDCNFHIYY